MAWTRNQSCWCRWQKRYEAKDDGHSGGRVSGLGSLLGIPARRIGRQNSQAGITVRRQEEILTCYCCFRPLNAGSSRHMATRMKPESPTMVSFRSRCLTRSAHEMPHGKRQNQPQFPCAPLDSSKRGCRSLWRNVLVCEGGRTFVPRLRLASKTGQPQQPASSQRGPQDGSMLSFWSRPVDSVPGRSRWG